MLSITLEDSEYWDKDIEEFVPIKGCELVLEHSLISISKWEAIWHKPYMSDTPKTTEETNSYVKCMTVNKVSDENVYMLLSDSDYEAIANYISNASSAVKFPKSFRERNNSSSEKEEITSELIYYYMIKFGIPFCCEKWHFKRLLNLIEIFEFKEMPKKKRSMSEIIEERRRINAERRAKYNTKG